jgi:hypothetical protein
VSGDATPHAIVNRLPGAWTGITAPHCELCSWAWHDGRMELKFRNSSCPVHGHGIAFGGPFRADVTGQEVPDERN